MRELEEVFLCAALPACRFAVLGRFNDIKLSGVVVHVIRCIDCAGSGARGWPDVIESWARGRRYEPGVCTMPFSAPARAHSPWPAGGERARAARDGDGLRVLL